MAFNHVAVISAALFFACGAVAQAQSPAVANYPDRTVRILVGGPAGSGTDIVARSVALKLTERWGKPVIIDNRTSGGETLAMQMTADAVPDGYTLFASSVGVTSTASLLKKVTFDVGDALLPVVQMTSQPYLMVVNPKLPVRSVKELVDYAKANPGKLNYASSGIGAASHLGMEMLKSQTGMDIVHVPYKAVLQGLTDMLGGQIQVLFSSAITTAPFLQNDQVRPIAITSAQRSSKFPDLPTVAETVPGFQLGVDYCFFAPKGTPPAIVALVNKAVSEAINAPESVARLTADGASPAPANTPEQFQARFKGEIARWDTFFKNSPVKFTE